MGQIVSSAAKPKRCNKNQLSQLGVLAAGLHVLVSSDNSMNAAGQGNFDCYIIGNGTTAATSLPLHKIEGLASELNAQINGETSEITIERTCRVNVAVNTTTIAAGATPFHVDAGMEVTILPTLNGCMADGNLNISFRTDNGSSLDSVAAAYLSDGVAATVIVPSATDYICLYCAKANVVAADTINISVVAKTAGATIASSVETLEQEMEQLMTDSADAVSIDYTTTPAHAINTTTIAAGAYPVSIPAGTPCLVRLTDNDSVLLSTLSVIFRNNDASETIGYLQVVKDTDYYFTPSENVYYICMYISAGNVGGSTSSSINVSIKYPVEDLPITQKVDYALSYAKGVDAKLDSEMQSVRKSSDFRGKTCIFIGDSISTGNGYQWKGMLEDNYNFKYARDTSGQLAPANGGIPLIPPTTEASDNASKSIWYRCANQRMNIYTFDCISLFGGTNDMNTSFYPDMELGTINDTPYVDTLDGFSSATAATLTATRPATLTYAAALMGCIEMLHRDFPTKTIILPSVIPCRGDYGNSIDSSGMRLSERMAILQMQIASRYSGGAYSASGKGYGVIAVPFYWYTRTYENAVTGAMSKDGVHPNLAQARNMAILFAENLFL